MIHLKTYETFESERWGSSRKVYDLGNGKVMKKAYKPIGLFQNKNEIEISKCEDVNSILPKIFNYDENYKWLITEEADLISEDEIRKHIKNFWYLNWYFENQPMLSKNIFEYFENNLFVQKLKILIDKYKLSHPDLENYKNYGLINGELKLIDFGLTTEYDKLNQNKYETDFISEKAEFEFEHDIEKEFKNLNKLLFNNELTLPPYDFVTDKHKVAKVTYTPYGNKYRINSIENIKLIFSKSVILSDEQFRNILAHEMIHLLQFHRKIFNDRGGDHGYFFTREMDRINDMKIGIKITKMDDTVLPSQMRKMGKEKDYYFILHNFREEYILCSFSSKEVCDYWWDRFGKVLQKDSKIYNKSIPMWLGRTQLFEMNRFIISRKNLSAQKIPNDFAKKLIDESEIYDKIILTPQ